MQKTFTVHYRRKREGKTNYKKRLALLSSGTPRLVVRRSLKHILVQVVQYKPAGDTILLSTNSKELVKLGWPYSTSNSSAAYLTGFLLAAKLRKTASRALVADIGVYHSVPKSRLYAVLKGCIDGGIAVPCSPEVFPSDERIKGSHVAAYAKQLKADKQKYAQQFSAYHKANADPEKMPAVFDTVKAAIQKGEQKGKGA